MQADKKDSKNSEWLAYSYFHYGLHDKALAMYKELAEQPHGDGTHHSYAAACLYHMGRYKEAEEQALKGKQGRWPGGCIDNSRIAKLKRERDR